MVKDWHEKQKISVDQYLPMYSRESKNNNGELPHGYMCTILE